MNSKVITGPGDFSGPGYCLRKTLKKDVAQLNYGLEPKLDEVLEMVSAVNDRNRQLDLVESRADNHEDRLFALEERLKRAYSATSNTA